MTGKIIIIEGYDGTGKTTLAKSLAKKFDGIYFPNPKGNSEFTDDMYSLMKKYTAIDVDVKILMFLSNHIINIKEMNSLKSAGNVVICDRSILSTLAYQFLTVERLSALLHHANVPMLMYDKALILTASTEAVMRRIEGRGADNLDQYFISNLEKIKTCYNDMTHVIYPIKNSMRIDTTEMSKKEVELIARTFIDN